MKPIAQGVLVLLAVVSAPAPAVAKDVKFFHDWMAVCPDDGTPCRASTFVLSRGSNQARYTLRVTPRGAGGIPDIRFIAARDPVNPAKPLTIRIDRQPAITLRPGTDYAVTEGTAFKVLNRAAARGLLPALRRGSKVLVSFVDSSGKDRSTGFSLRGSGKALAFAGSTAPRAASGTARAAAAATSGGDWSKGLPSLLPAIAACVDSARVREPRVLKAAKTESGSVAVRIRARDGARWDCLASSDGTPVEPMPPPLPPDAAKGADEGNPVFTAAGLDRPTENCWRHEPARDDQRRQVGWLSYRTC